MKLISLKLLHYRRFRQEEIVFKDDFSLIFWKNWSWKTSILDAVWYALFWPTSKDFVRVNRWFSKSYFLSDREPSKIELVFQYWFDNYRIVRIIDAWIKKFASDFISETKDILIWPNWLEIIGWDEINDFVSNLIWINKETFLRSVFTRQKDLEVLSWWLSERKELINKILWLNRIEDIISDFKKEEKDKKTLLEIYKNKIKNFDNKTISKQKLDFLTNKKELNKNLKLKEIELKEIEKNFNSLKNDFEFQDKKRIEFDNISNKIISLNNQVKFFSEQLKKNNLELEKIEEKITNLEKKFNDDFLKNLQIEENNLEKILIKKEEKVSQKLKLENKINSIRNEFLEIKQEINNLEKLKFNADCPTCKRPLLDYFPNLMKIMQEKLSSKIKEWKTLKEWKFLIILKELEVFENEIKTKKIFLENLKQEEKEFIKISENKINLEKNILVNNENILLNKKEVEILKKNLKKIKFNNEDYQKIKSLFINANSIINTKQKEINNDKQNILKIDFEIKSLIKQENDFKEDKKQIDFLVLEVDNLNLKKSIMSDYIIYLLNYLKPKIEDLASEYFTIITDYKYSQITLDEEYNILIDQKNLYLYSWWEIDLANLCLRLSLGQNLTSAKWNPINFLVLDEVLSSQDTQRQQNILKNLKKLENKFSQIILISHLEEMKELATNLIEIKALNKEESIVSY